MDWHAIGVIAGWILPAIAGGIITWLAERRPKLMAWFPASAAVTLHQLPGGQTPPVVHTHSVMIRNRGRKAATNVRIGHNVLPAFSLFPPSVSFTTLKLQGMEEQIVFPVLPPRTQVQISYVYFPPLIYSQIHAGVSSDEGPASARDVVINPRPTIGLVLIAWSLWAVGLVGVLFAVYKGGALLLAGH